MVLQEYKIDGDYICISKKELEELVEHYNKVAEDFLISDHFQWYAYYHGKRAVILDLLKMFEPLMG